MLSKLLGLVGAAVFAAAAVVELSRRYKSADADERARNGPDDEPGEIGTDSDDDAKEEKTG